MEKKEIRIMASKNNEAKAIEVADFAKQLQCAFCSRFEPYCMNCAHNDSGYCDYDNEAVSDTYWCRGWRRG